MSCTASAAHIYRLQLGAKEDTMTFPGSLFKVLRGLQIFVRNNIFEIGRKQSQELKLRTVLTECYVFSGENFRFEDVNGYENES